MNATNTTGNGAAGQSLRRLPVFYRIAAESFVPFDLAREQEDTEATFSFLADAHCMDISAVTPFDDRQFFEKPLAENVPTFVPPFEIYWMEAKVEDERGVRTGWLTHTVHPDDDPAKLFDLVRRTQQFEAKWILSIQTFIARPGERVWECFRSLLPIAADGAPHDGVLCMRHPSDTEKIKESRHVTTWWTMTRYAAAHQLLGCKNISLEPREVTPQEDRRMAKRFGDRLGGWKHHVLIVRPVGAKSSTPGRELGIMAEHVCRGHMQRYGPKFNRGLLFGRYEGAFYVPQHVKGQRKNGIVSKDYKLVG